MADRIANDMLDMARSYEPQHRVPMLQDRAKQAFQSAKKKFGGSKSAREAADTPKSGPSKAKEAGSNAIQGGHGLVGVLRKSFDKRGDEDARQHREVMQSQRRQTSALREVQGSVSSIQNMMQSTLIHDARPRQCCNRATPR